MLLYERSPAGPAGRPGAADGPADLGEGAFHTDFCNFL